MSNCVGRPPRVALAGCGWFAQAAHLPALRQLEADGVIKIVALCSRSEASLHKAQALLLQPIKAYTSFDEMLQSEEIDAVDLVLPTQIMASSIRKSLEANKHVISEKPCAINAAESKSLLKHYENYSKKLSWSVAENWPFKPTVQTTAHILRKGVLGKPKTINFNLATLGWQNDSGWRSSSEFRGGYIMDSGVHFVSMLRHISGGILEVRASVSWREPNFVADSVNAELIFENDVKGNFVLSFSRPSDLPNNFQLSVGCENGTLLVDFMGGKILLQSGDINHSIDVPNDPWVQGGVYPMLRDFFVSLSTGSKLSRGPIEGVKDVAVVEAMIESDRIARPVAPAIFYNQLNGSGPIIQTYAGMNNFNAEHTVQARAVSDIKASIKEAASRGLKVRAIGQGNSWAPYLKTNDVSIGTSGLNFITSTDRKNRLIKAGAGTRLGDLTRALAEQDLCLPSIPFFPNATLGGAIATAMHGTSPQWGTISDFVHSITVITATGEVLRIDESSNAVLLPAARVAVGMLGITIEAELKVVDMRWVRNVRIDLTLDEFTNYRNALFSNFEHIWIHWILGEERLVVQCLETKTSPEDGFVPYVSNESGSWVLAYQTAQRGPAPDEIMLSMQYGVPLEQLSDAIAQISKTPFFAENLGREIEIKFLKKIPASYLGPNCDNDTALFNTWWPVQQDKAQRVFSELELVMQGLSARPHWGKFHTPPSIDYMRKAYPKWEQFNDVRKRLDPTGIFSAFAL